MKTGSCAIIFALLLSNARLGWTETSGRKDIAYGIFALLAGDTVEHPFHDLASNPCWTNPNITGIVLRTNWAKIQPAEGQYDWSFLDLGLALARQHHRPVAITVVAGAGPRSPAWIYAIGAKPFVVTEHYAMPAPWDPVFKKYWSALVQTLAARYDDSPLVAYVTMGGPGRGEELYLTHSPNDQEALNSVGGIRTWINAANSIIDMYAAAFKATPFLYALGSPIPQPAGGQALAEVVKYGVSNYPGRFGLKHDGLAPYYLPPPGRGWQNSSEPRFPYGTKPFAVTQIPALSANCPVGFQMLAASKGGMTMGGGTLQMALADGLKLKAHFIEVYGADCSDPYQQTVIADANQRLLAGRTNR